MSLYKRPLEEILSAIKSLNGVVLVESEYTYGNPTVVADDGSGTNTSISIVAKDINSPYDGAATVRYRRLNLADLTQLVPTNIRGYKLDTMMAVAQRLNVLYGTNFTTDDIVDGPSGLVNGVGDVTLVAKSTSLGWLGSVKFTCALGSLPIEDFVLQSTLPGLSYPNAQVTKPYAPMYSYWRDFTAANDLLTVGTGATQIGTVILQALKTITGDAWVSDKAARYSLLGATVRYAGETADLPLESNPDYEHVIVVDLLEVNSLGLSGSLYLHFDDPL